jgi:cytidyltransferase-like protein
MEVDKESRMKIAVFSGRFDPPHIGHVISIQKLADMHDIVIVPILNYQERFISPESAQGVFVSVFEHLHTSSLVKFVINCTHFARITLLGFDILLKECGIDQSVNNVIYYAGNNEVLENMMRIGVRCEYLNRSIDEIYTGTKIKTELTKVLNNEERNPQSF